MEKKGRIFCYFLRIGRKWLNCDLFFDEKKKKKWYKKKIKKKKKN